MGPLGAIVSGHMNFRRGFPGCSIAPAAALIVTAVFGTASAAQHGNPKNLWPEPWGTPNQPLTSREPFAPAIVGTKQGQGGDRAEGRGVQRHPTLGEAQHIIATDWFQYYRDHVLK
jgi:hypothetical protein